MQDLTFLLSTHLNTRADLFGHEIVSWYTQRIKLTSRMSGSSSLQAKRNVRLVNDVPSSIPCVLADSGRIMQVFYK